MYTIKDEYKVMIKGVQWTIGFSNETADPALINAMGISVLSSKRILINENLFADDCVSSVVDTLFILKKVVRHELIHSILGECGLDGCANVFGEAWCVNEEMVDFFAAQHHELHELVVQGEKYVTEVWESKTNPSKKIKKNNKKK